MKKDPVSSSDISAAALKVFSREELVAMPRPQRLSLMSMIERRLNKDDPPPTLAELQEMRELVEEHLWHPALGQLQATSQG